MSYTLPSLYCIDKKSKRRIWTIEVDDDVVTTSYGEVGGKQIVNTRTIVGVNIGKKSETSAEEQAKIYAERSWVQQLGKGYAPDSEDKKGVKKYLEIQKLKKDNGGNNVNADTIFRGGKQKNLKKNVDNGVVPQASLTIKPMLCDKWSTEPKVVKYFDFKDGVWIQPKLDGIRCLAFLFEGEVVLWTRQGKQLVWLKHIREGIKRFLEPYPDVVLDGEIYADTLIDDGEIVPISKKFEIITSAARPSRSDPSPFETQLQYHVFDLADVELNQRDRLDKLNKMFSKTKGKTTSETVIKVPTILHHDIDTLDELLDSNMEEGYEGIILRSNLPKATYANGKRSLFIRKYKNFIDSEYEIVGTHLDKGVGKEHFVWVCTTEENQEFHVKPMGTKEQKLKWIKDRSLIGKQLTVKYQELSSEGIPRFPRGIAIRDYE